MSLSQQTWAQIPWATWHLQAAVFSSVEWNNNIHLKSCEINQNNVGRVYCTEPDI